MSRSRSANHPLLRRSALTALLLLAGTAIADDRAAQLDKLRSRIEQLQRELNDTRGRRDTAREELHAQEQRIDKLLRALREIDGRLQQHNRTLGDLQRRAQRERAHLKEQYLALESQIRAAHAIGQQPYLKLLLNQEDPAAATRVLTYYRYFNDARLARISGIRVSLARIETLEEEIRVAARDLTGLREAQERERGALEDTRQRRAELLAGLNRQVAGQTQEIERLRADEQRLERLVRELKTVLPESNIPFPTGKERFGSLKGKLPLPVSGHIGARFGQPKGFGDMTWRGLFISGKEGQNVHSVSRGRVVYADWLKGFGLLLILDHGDGYMTLYGHNQTLFRRAGDWVEAGQPVAAVGNTGDAPGTGVYFEIRHNGIPNDPLQWCATGRAGAARTRR